MTALSLSTVQLDRICQQVLDEYPAEACGLFLGTLQNSGSDYVVEEIVPATNILAHLSGRFEVDPKVRFLAEKRCRETGRQVIGHWHSHPDTVAQPSETDLSMAYEPNLVWMILSTDGKRIASQNAFLPPQKGGESFRQIVLQIT